MSLQTTLNEPKRRYLTSHQRYATKVSHEINICTSHLGYISGGEI